MKINGYGNVPDLVKAYSNQKKRSEEFSKESPLLDKEQDTLELSVEAKEMQEIKAALDNTSSVRTDKIAKIKEEIKNGQFKIDTDKIAEGIIQERLLDKEV